MNTFKGFVLVLLNITFLPITFVISILALFNLIGGGQGEIIWRWLSFIQTKKII